MQYIGTSINRSSQFKIRVWTWHEVDEVDKCRHPQSLPPRQLPVGGWRKSWISFVIPLELVKKDKLFYRAWQIKEDDLVLV